MDSSKNIVSLVTKNNKGLTENLKGEDQDLASLLMTFLQKMLKLTEKTDKPFVHLRLLRLTGSLLFFFPVENKLVECQIFIQKVLENYRNIKKEGLDFEYIELLALVSFGMHVFTDLLAEEKEGHMEEESYLTKLIAQFKEESKVGIVRCIWEYNAIK